MSTTCFVLVLLRLFGFTQTQASIIPDTRSVMYTVNIIHASLWFWQQLSKFKIPMICLTTLCLLMFVLMLLLRNANLFRYMSHMRI